MPLRSRQRGPIAVYGATGYTGKLVAAELKAADADFVLSGRNRAKLDALAEEIGGARVQEASLEDPASLKGLLGDCAAVIACAGPFSRHGEPLLKAAVETATHYLDTTGEQPYIRMAYDRYGADAERAGVAVVPAVGFDYVPGDMLAALTADGMGDVDDVTLAYDVTEFGMTRGTQLSALEMMKGDDVEWRKLQWMPASRTISRGSFAFPDPVGRQRMARYPAGEQIMVPRHVSTRRVQTVISAASISPHPALGPILPLLARSTGLLARTPASKLLRTMVNRLPEGPSEPSRRSARFTIVCDVTRGTRVRRGVVRGSDVYGLTAASVVQGALIAAQGGISASGGLAPSQAFEPERFLANLGRFDVAWEIQGERRREPAEVVA